MYVKEIFIVRSRLTLLYSLRFMLACCMLFLSACKEEGGGLYRFYDAATELYGFKTENGKIIISPQYTTIEAPDDVALFTPQSGEFKALVPVQKNGHFYRMNSQGALVFESVYFDNGADYFSEGLARFLKNGKVGFHDVEGKIVIHPLYDFASPFKGGVSNVCDGCVALYPENPVYSALSSEGRPLPKKEMYKRVVGGRWGQINIKGEVIVPLKFNSYEEVQAQKAELEAKPVSLKGKESQ